MISIAPWLNRPAIDSLARRTRMIDSEEQVCADDPSQTGRIATKDTCVDVQA